MSVPLTPVANMLQLTDVLENPLRSTTMRTICCTCLILLLSAAPAAAREIFVDNRSGDDRATGQQANNTGDMTGPVRTIGKALALAEAGDTLVLAANSEPYHESFSLVGSRYSGAARPFTIRGNGAILDGTMPVPPEAWEPYQGTVFRFQPRLTGYQQLYLGGRPAPRVVVADSARRPPPLRAGQWCLFGGLIYFGVEKTKLPGDYDLRCSNWQTGITLYHVDRVVISDLIVQGFQLDGISAFNSARDVALAGVTCRGNGRAGITRRRRVDGRDQPVAAGRQRRGPTAQFALQPDAPGRDAVALEHRTGLGQSRRTSVYRWESGGDRSGPVSLRPPRRSRSHDARGRRPADGDSPGRRRS